MGTISEASLQKADIIASTTSAGVSVAIRTGSVSSVSHARLYVGNGEVIEAVGEGVVRAKLSTVLSSDTLAIAYRRKDMNDGIADIVIRFAERQIGKSYDYAGVAGAGSTTPGGIIVGILFPIVGLGMSGAGASNMISPDSKFFCSELVTRAFEEANAPIIGRPATISRPGDILASHFLQQLGYLKGG